MESGQNSQQDSIEASLFQCLNKVDDKPTNVGATTTLTTLEFRDRIKNLNTKSSNSSAVNLLATNTLLLPSEIIHAKLQDTVLIQAPSTSSSASSTEIPRNKIALARGHSLMDWMRLGASGQDLSGVGSQFLVVTPSELAKHNKQNDAWIAIRGIVFNISLYMDFHPGGISELMKGAGKDSTKLFEEIHAWVNYQSILQKCIIGRLQNSINTEYNFEKNINNSVNQENIECIDDLPIIKMYYTQTASSISLFYTIPSNNPLDEVHIKKLENSELALHIYYAKTQNISYNVKLAKDVEWPPTFQERSEISEEIVFKKKDKGIWKMQDISIISNEKRNLSTRMYNKYEVLENTLLCKIIHLLILRAQNYIQVIPPGRHVEVKLNIMGTEVSRLYTPVPRYLHSDVRLASNNCDDYICLIVKHYKSGKMTPNLTSLQPGQVLELSNTLGNFYLEAYDQYTTIHLLAAGTGLTTMLSIIKRTLSKRNTPYMNLIIFNTNEGNIFYAEQLDHISEKYKLRVTHVLSAASSTWKGRSGIISNELLNDLIGKHSNKACVFTCGPIGFMKITKELLRNLGWQSSQVHEFNG
ncbi:PREDICTED: cytochrome b5 reductase 4 [Ceratosolen solmsi marchali]|uniref:Cytochrome b5 reductase 4 n=1 Tax=Ceratosolen solmsi marchali TaxID=326594 RepID=A0AAJ6YQU0_9HYME|nr:PREDICTED: cytochrome b5 reductase 4 [Ceratosolen solmsi marchali]